MPTYVKGFKMENYIEKRGLIRLRPREGAFAIIWPRTAIHGQIVDITQDGLAFCYIDNGEQTTDSHQLDIYITGSGFCLNRVEFKTVSDAMIKNESPLSVIMMRRCGVKFSDLSPHQVLQLQYFIQNYTSGELKLASLCSVRSC
jgi:hypothetical protein